MGLTREDASIKIEEITKEMTSLSSSISEIDYVRNPMKELRSLINKMDGILEYKNSLIEQLEKVKSEFINLSQDINPLSANIDLINKKESDLNALSDKVKDAIEEYKALKLQSEKYNNDSAYIRYKELFMERYHLKRSLGVESKKETSEIKAAMKNPNSNSINLMDNMVRLINVDSKFLDKIKQFHGYELTSKADGMGDIVFSSGDGSRITISEDTVSYSNLITSDNMKTVVPALIAIYLKSTEGLGVSGCSIRGYSPEVAKYFEEMLANELMKRSPNYASYTINDVRVEDIVNRQAKKEITAENIDSQFYKTTSRP